MAFRPIIKTPLAASTSSSTQVSGGGFLTYTSATVAAGAPAGAAAGTLSSSLTSPVFSVRSGSVSVNSSTGALTTTAAAPASGAITADVQAVDAAGLNGEFMQISVPVQVSAPTVTKAPSLSTSTPAVGSKITPTPGVYTGSPSVTAQWFYADTGTLISGAPTTPGSYYTPVSADSGHPIKYIETATNTAGQVASAAPATSAVLASAAAFPATSLRTTLDFTTALLASTAMPAFAATTGGQGSKEVLVDTSTTYQSWIGAGAALTDSAAYTIMTNMTASQRMAFLTSIFSPTQGLGLNFLRLPMGDPDYTSRNANGAGNFSIYDNSTTDDGLASISFAQDLNYIIPVLLLILSINPNVRIICAPWSAPQWMKTTASLIGGANYFVDTAANNAEYAQYFVKYQQFLYQQIGKYAEYTTVQNEPNFSPGNYPGTEFNPQDITALGVAVNAAFSSAKITTQILSGDTSFGDTKSSLSLNPFQQGGSAAAAFAGAAYHAYDGQASQMQEMAAYPGKLVMMTEHCGILQTKGTSGFNSDWAAFMGDDLIASPAYGAQAILFWNLALDPNGQPGPTDDLAPVANISTSGAVSFTPQYYALAQLASYVLPGATRVACSSFGAYGRGGSDVQAIAFLNPNQVPVAILFNSGTTSATVTIKDQQAAGQYTTVTLTAGEVRSVTWKNAAASAAVPDAPNVLVTAQSATQISVSLAGTPPSNNGSPITGYDILDSSQSGAEAVIAQNVPLPYLIAGFTAGQKEYVEVRARNAVGPSLTSAEANATTTAAASVPYLLASPNTNAYTSQNVTQDVTDGYIDITVSAALANVSSINQALFSKWPGASTTPSSTNASYYFFINSNGYLETAWYDTAVRTTTCSVKLNTVISSGQRVWLRTRLNVGTAAGPNGVAAGTCQFFYSTDGSNYTQIGTTNTGLAQAGIKATTTTVNAVFSTIDGTGNVSSGKFFSAKVLNSAGTVLFSPDFTLLAAGQTGTFQDTAATPNTWSINGLVATTAAPTHFLCSPGNPNAGVSSTSNANNNVTDGYIDIKMWINLRSYVGYSSSVAMTLISNYTLSGSKTNSEWLVGLDNTGKLFMYYFNANGTFVDCASSVTVGSASPSASSGIWLRIVLNTSAGALNGFGAGTATFYTSSDNGSGSPSGWTQLGTTNTGAGTGGLNNVGTSAPGIRLGSIASSNDLGPAGQIFKASITNSAGALLYNPDFTAQATGVTSFSDAVTTAANDNSIVLYGNAFVA